MGTKGSFPLTFGFFFLNEFKQESKWKQKHKEKKKKNPRYKTNPQQDKPNP